LFRVLHSHQVTIIFYLINYIKEERSRIMAGLWVLGLSVAVVLALFIGMSKAKLAIIYLTNEMLFLAWLIFSSCLGDSLRLRQPTFDRNYMRTITSSGHGNWNQVEMDDMLGDQLRNASDSD